MKWTFAEIEFLRQNYETKTAIEIAKMLGRDVYKTRREISKLNLGLTTKIQRWTSTDENILRENWETKTAREIIKMLDNKRSLESLSGKRCKMGLVKDLHWTKEENEKFKELYPISLRSKLKEAFPNRGNFTGHAFQLGLKKEIGIHNIIMKTSHKIHNVFSKDEEKELEKLFKLGLSQREIASKFPSHSVNSISVKLRRMRLIYFKRWTNEEDIILTEIFTRPKKEILQQLPNRTWGAIYNRMRTLGFYRKSTDQHLTNFVKKNHPKIWEEFKHVHKREYHQKNREQILIRQKEYYQINKERLVVYARECRQKPEVKQRIKEYNGRLEVKQRNLERSRTPERKQQMVEYRQKSEVKQRMKKYQRERYLKNRERIRKQGKERYLKKKLEGKKITM